MEEAGVGGSVTGAPASGDDGGQSEPEEALPGPEKGAEPQRSAAPAADSASESARAATTSGASVDSAVGPGGARRAPGARQFVSPLVRRLARERGIDLTGVVGSGPHGRIVRRDLERLQDSRPTPTAASDLAPAPTQPPATSRRVPADTGHASSFTEIPHTGMRRAIARRLAESKATVPHFYLSADCRVDGLLALRAQLNETASLKVSVNDLVVKAVAWALRDVPEVNATWSDDVIRQYAHADISVAVALPTGLITPVLRGVDQMSVSEVSAGIRDLAERAREGRLKQHEIEGGVFSVSNLGMYGVKEFSAIINPPQAGILAVSAASRRPVVSEDGEIQAATVMTVTLSADHRVIDGAVAARWLSAFKQRIENPLSIII